MAGLIAEVNSVGNVCSDLTGGVPRGRIAMSVAPNGTRRVDSFMPYSGVLEIDPVSNEIVWSYQEQQNVDFFSPHLSSAQRLPNGNTLVRITFVTGYR